MFLGPAFISTFAQEISLPEALRDDSKKGCVRKRLLDLKKRIIFHFGGRKICSFLYLNFFTTKKFITKLSKFKHKAQNKTING